MPTIDLAKDDLRALNQQLQTAARAVAKAQSNETEWRIDNPGGSHAIAVGLDGPIAVTVGGSVTASHSTVSSAGTPTRIGGSTSNIQSMVLVDDTLPSGELPVAMTVFSSLVTVTSQR